MSEVDAQKLVEALLTLAPTIRYVAVLQKDKPVSRQRDHVESASSSESDRYEELLTNPTLLVAAGQRGRIDCGGLRYLFIRYGNFFQLVQPYKDGHVSVCLDLIEDPVRIASLVQSALVKR